MKNSLKVIWTYPLKKEQKTHETIKKVDNFIQFIKITNDIIERFQYKIIPFIRQGQKYFNLKIYQYKIKQKFITLKLLQQRQQQKQFINYLKYNDQIDRRSNQSSQKNRKIDIHIQFQYKRSSSNNQIQQMRNCNQQIKNMRNKLFNRMKNSDYSYLNNLRQIKKGNSLISKFSQTIKIYFLISQPLVKMIYNQANQTIKQTIKSQINIEQHSKIIKQVHSSKNSSINIIFDKRYITTNKLAQLIQQTKYQTSIQRGDEKIDLIIIHIYTQLYKLNNQIFVSLQDDYNIGMQNRKMKLIDLIKKLNQIPNLYLLILLGQKMRILKQKQQQDKINKNYYQIKWYKQIYIPIITINSFDISKDLLFIKKILQELYKKIFQRQQFKDKYQEIKQLVQSHIDNNYPKDQSIVQCCCLHTDFDHCLTPNNSNKQSVWARIVSKIGISTAHRLFFHEVSKQFINPSKLMPQLASFILNDKIPSDQLVFCKNQQYHKCYRTNIGDFEIFNKQIVHNWPQQTQKPQIGIIKSDNTQQQNKLQLYRPLIMYKIIKQIIASQQNKIKCFILLGCSRVGKSLFLQLIQKYILSRNYSKLFQFIHIKNWRQQQKNCQLTKSILDIYYRYNSNNHNHNNNHNNNNNIKLIVNFGKIHNQLKQYFHKFIKQFIKISQNKNILIICALSESHKLQDETQYIEQYQIQRMSNNEMLSMLLKSESITIKKPNELNIIKQISNIFKKRQSQCHIQSDFNYFCINLRDIIRQILQKQKGINQTSQLQKIIIQQLQKYKNKTTLTLDRIYKINQQLWNAVGFVCSFKQGFFICDFNQIIALYDKNFADQFIKYKNDRVFRIDLLQNDNKNHKFLRTMSILAQNNCFFYFKKQLSTFFLRKVNYFLYFYFKIYQLIKKYTEDPIYSYCQRAIKKLGIFMFDHEQILQKLIENDKKSYIQLQNLQKITKQKRQYIYNNVLQMHIKAYIQFLKQATDNNYPFMQHLQDSTKQQKGYKQQIQLKIIHTILLVVIIHQYQQTLQQDKRQILYGEIIKYLKKKIKKYQKKDFLVLAYQIQSIAIGRNVYDQHVGNHVNNDKTTLKILQNLSYYQQIRTAIAKQRKQLRVQFNKLLEKYQIKSQIQSKIQSKVQQQQKQPQTQKLQIAQKLKKMMTKIKNLSQLLSSNIKNQQLQSIYKIKHEQCLIDLQIIKIIIYFYFFNTQVIMFQQIDLLSIKNIKFNYDNVHHKSISDINAIKICQTYIQIITTKQCTYDDIKNINTDNISIQLKQIYHYISLKLNPKIFFKSDKVGKTALFMKASFLKHQGVDYTFVRMGNIISSFMHKQFKDYNLNLLFLNLSRNNFKMVSEQQAYLTYLILSVDCIEQQDKLKLLFEDEHGIQSMQITIDEFINWLKKIRYKFLIIFGSKSHKLSEQIQRLKINIQKQCIISLLFINKQLNLSTYPLIKNIQYHLSQFINQFVKIKNSQRIMEIMICSFIYFLIHDKQNQLNQLKKCVIEKYVTDSKTIGIKVIQKWYNNNKQLSKLRYEIDQKIYLNEKQPLLFPIVSKGKLKNLTQQIIAMPKNFDDDNYYQNLGRIDQIQQIITKLTSSRNCLITIEGTTKSGKTELLKQIGWICQTRRIFQFGVYIYDVRQKFTSHHQQDIIQHINKSTKNKKSMLILLDNLDNELFEQNQNFFKNLFQLANKASISIIYTINNNIGNKKLNIQQLFLDKKNKHYHGKNKQILFNVNVNKLSFVQKICIVIAHLRNRGIKSYIQMITQNTNLLKNLQLPQTFKLDINIKQKKSPKTIKKISDKQKNGCVTKKKITKQRKLGHINRMKTCIDKYSNEQIELCQKLNLKSTASTNKLDSQYSDQQSIYSQQLISQTQSKTFSQQLSQTQSNSKIQDEQLLQARSDLFVLLQQCRQYKKNEQKIDFGINYLNFDIDTMSEQIIIILSSKICIINNFYFKKFNYY